ncbi:MAG: pyridoxal-phosphate dependent enzyme [Bacteroidales bacterium]|nr:pyridoxal-phosphate dependent enzyme [Bacteroidales bacterium]
MSGPIPVFSQVQEAHRRISKYIHRTPVLSSSSIDSILGCELLFKCENFQKVGAFKFRGACNAVFSLSDEEAMKGVGTHSSGNHAAALALAARMRGIKSYIVMPDNSPDIKKKAVAGYGAEITYCEPTLEARESTMEKVIEQTGANFIHPYNFDRIICGQATAAKELLEDYPDLQIVMAPVGGGGLLSGTAISSKSINPNIKVIAAEPSGADDAYRSFKSGQLIPSTNPKTIADGLLTSLGDLTLEIILKHVDDILRVEEETIVKAMRMIYERMKIIVEPSSAVPLAAIMENPHLFQHKKTGIILSGGNVDLDKLPFTAH